MLLLILKFDFYQLEYHNMSNKMVLTHIYISTEFGNTIHETMNKIF